MKDITASKFQFTNPIVNELILKRNKNFDKSAYEGMAICYDTTVYDMQKNTATLMLEVEIGEESEKAPFYLKVSVVSNFLWSDEIEKMSESLLKKNGTTLLLSYARPLIAHITVDAGFRPFNLPFVDLREDIKKM